MQENDNEMFRNKHPTWDSGDHWELGWGRSGEEEMTETRAGHTGAPSVLLMPYDSS